MNQQTMDSKASDNKTSDTNSKANDEAQAAEVASELRNNSAEGQAERRMKGAPSWACNYFS